MAWAQDKISKSEHYVEAVYDYMMYNNSNALQKQATPIKKKGKSLKRKKMTKKKKISLKLKKSTLKM